MNNKTNFDNENEQPEDFGAVAAAGSSQSTVTALTKQYNAVTGADGTKGVALPPGLKDTKIYIINTSTVSALPVYPANDRSDQINSIAVDGAFSLGAGAAAWFICTSDTQWYAEDIASNVSVPVALAATGSSASDAAVITSKKTAVTAVDGTKGVALPAAAIGESFFLVNTSTVSVLPVYPVSGGNDNINSLAEDAAFSLQPGESAWFIPTSATQFYTPDIVSNVTVPVTLAAAGSSASDAGVITSKMTAVTAADGTKGVALPAAEIGKSYLVVNTVNDQILPIYPVSGGNDIINEQAEDIPFILAPGEAVWFIPTSATQFYADSSKEANPTTDRRTIRFELFDDFLAAALDATNNWIAFAGGDSDATIALTVAGVPEGQILMGSGGTGDATDGSVLSLILPTKGSLVSLGTTVFECRVSFDQLTGTSWNFGLADILAEGTERSIFTIDSGTVADISISSSSVNDVIYGFSSDATATDKWQFCHMSNSVVGNSAAEEASANGPTANTYDVLRIEVDANGDARFYLNGALEKTVVTAVQTTAILIPFIGGDSGTDADIATDVHIDYIKFEGTRPASDA